MNNHWSEKLVKLRACREAILWAQSQPDEQTAWEQCTRGDWLHSLKIKTIYANDAAADAAADADAHADAADDAAAAAAAAYVSFWKAEAIAIRAQFKTFDEWLNYKQPYRKRMQS